jgi:3-hydroxyisobutyrate dehydrogenase
VKTAKVGVIGLGNMGRGIAQNLLRAGHDVEVWDIAKGARARWRHHPRAAIKLPHQMAAECAVIFFVVPGATEIGSMLGGEDGILSHAHPQLVLYDLTTSDPLRTRQSAQIAARRGVKYLDAGMSGGAKAAEEGTVTLMVGGDAGAFRRTRKILASFARHIFYLGKSGSGHTLKLIHNLVCHTIFVVTCEGCRIAARTRIDIKDAIAVFNHGNARSYVSEVRFPRHILSKQWDGKSRVYNLHKDLAMAVALAGRVGVDIRLGKETLGFLTAAMTRGMENEDFTLLYRKFDRIRKLQAASSRH